jgi:uncharacterized protein
MTSEFQQKPRVVLAGGSGFIGNALRDMFSEAGYEVAILSRSRRMEEGVVRSVWDGETIGPWASLLEGAVAVINLAGEHAHMRWTDENRVKILESRTKSTAVIGKAIRSCATPPKVWINASGVGYYGDRGDEVLDESSSAGEGFLVDVCLAWERAQLEVETPGTRKVQIRIGMALGRGGGAFPQLSKFTKLFLGGSQGSGKQWAAWVHLDDLTSIVRWIVESDFEGPVNGVGPEPVRNSDLMATMRKVMGRPWSPPAPAFALKMAGVVMGVQTDVVLQSQRTKSKVLAEHGFEYKFKDLESALRDLVRPLKEAEFSPEKPETKQ